MDKENLRTRSVRFHPITENVDAEEIQEIDDIQNVGCCKTTLEKLRIFFLGTPSDVYVKPKITKTACFFLLLNVHLNIRFLCMFAEHVMDSHSLNVALLYALTQLLLCPTLYHLYSFLGVYSQRSFISLWEMVPLFQGISGTMIILELYKTYETSLIVSSGLMMLFKGYYSHSAMFDDVPVKELVKRGIVLCGHNESDWCAGGYGIPFGASRLFNTIGNDIPKDGILSTERVGFMIMIWVFITVWYMLATAKMKSILEQGSPIIAISLILIMAIYSIYNSDNFDLPYGLQYNVLYDQLTIIFAIAEYLPSHLVTIGYLHSCSLTRAQIWSIPLTTSIIGLILSYGVLYFGHEFAHILDTEFECVRSFGLHMYLVLVPYSIRYRFGSYVGMTLITIYIMLFSLNGISYVITNIKLLMWAFKSYKHWAYRYRNILCLSIILFVFALSIISCRADLHRRIHDMDRSLILEVTMILYIITVLGIAIYGSRRISEDYQYLFGTEYPYMLGLKILYAITMGHAILNLIITYYSIIREFKALLRFPNYIIVSILLVPIFIGVVMTIVRRKAYYGIIISPLPTWGRPNNESRLKRRRMNMRQMFIYQTRRKCIHNCLSDSIYLKAEIEEEIRLRKIFLRENSTLAACDCNDRNPVDFGKFD